MYTVHSPHTHHTHIYTWHLFMKCIWPVSLQPLSEEAYSFSFFHLQFFYQLVTADSDQVHNDFLCSCSGLHVSQTWCCLSGHLVTFFFVDFQNCFHFFFSFTGRFQIRWTWSFQTLFCRIGFHVTAFKNTLRVEERTSPGVLNPNCTFESPRDL